MGLFTTIGTALGGPVGAGLGAAADIGLGFIGGAREKRGIEDAAAAERFQTQESLNQNELLRERLLGRVDPTIDRGERAASTIEGILTGEQRLAPTAGEIFAKEQALVGVDRASAGRKQILSGRRLEDFGTKFAGISSQFRQQDIENLDRLAGRGFQGIQVGQRADVGVTSQQDRLRQLLSGTSSAEILGKSGVDVGNIANIGENLGNFGELLRA